MHLHSTIKQWQVRTIMFPLVVMMTPGRSIAMGPPALLSLLKVWQGPGLLP